MPAAVTREEGDAAAGEIAHHAYPSAATTDADWLKLDGPAEAVTRTEEFFALLNSGRTTGVFQLESGGMQNLCRQISLSSIDEIVAGVRQDLERRRSAVPLVELYTSPALPPTSTPPVVPLVGV